MTKQTVHVAKLILTDENDKYLLLHRSNHPVVPYDPDLPGGIIEEGEDPISALIREMMEETGVVLDARTVEKVYESSSYHNGYTYHLYQANCVRPPITISWEHSSYEWLARDDFMLKANTAVDRYMRMVYDYLSQNSSMQLR